MEIKVRVKTKQPETRITKQENNIYFISLKSPPHKGKANIELIKFLRKYFKKQVLIKSGFKSKQKVITLL